MDISRNEFIKLSTIGSMGLSLIPTLANALPYDVPFAKNDNQKPKTMYSCQWNLKIVFGKQKEALDIMKQWGAEKFRSSNFKVSTNRVMTGFVGESASHVVDEYVFESLADFEKALADMSQPQFKPFAEAIAPYVVPGSQEWKIYRILA